MTTVDPMSTSAAEAESKEAPASSSKSRGPQRKISVFSHDGFQNLHQLDQTALKQRSISQTQLISTAASSAPAACAPFSKPSLLLNDNATSPPPKSTKHETNDKQAAGLEQQQQQAEAQAPGAEAAEQQYNAGDKARRSARSDTLGSTGSSRASSCDEPTILATDRLKTITPISPSLKSNRQVSLPGPLAAPSSARIAPAEQKQQQLSAEERQSPDDATSASSNSSCSVDSMGAGKTSWAQQDRSETTLQQQQQEQPMQQDEEEEDDDDDEEEDEQADDATNLASEPFQQSDAAKPTTSAAGNIPPPFVSIKSQLVDGKAIPNAQLIQQHIDKLISENEKIIENCNLVSIRSYNSSKLDLQQQQQPAAAPARHRSSVAVCSTARSNPSAATSSPVDENSTDNASSENNEATPTASTANSVRPSQSGTSQMTNKRWSTTALGSPVSSFQSHLIPKLSVTGISSNGGSTTSGFSSDAQTATSISSLNGQQQHPFGSARLSSMVPSTRAKRSSTTTSCFAESATRQVLQTQPLDANSQLASRYFLFTPANSQPLMSVSAQENTDLDGSISMPSSPKPNISILDVQRFLSSRFNMSPTAAAKDVAMSASGGHLSSGERQAPNSESIESAIENLSLKRRSEATLFDGVSHSNSTQSVHSQRDELVLEALLLEQQRRQQHQHQQQRQQQQQQQHQYFPSTSNNNNNAFSLCQQQVLEQQLDQIRLAASLEHQHQQQQQQQQQQRVAVAALALNNLSQQHHGEPTSSSSQQQRHQIAAFMALQRQEQLAKNMNDSIVSTSEASAQYLRDHQALETRLLNEFLAKMMLNRTSTEEPKLAAPPMSSVLGNSFHFEPSQRHPSLSHGTELLTQSLDSAKPTHRCDACDISFWTRDLLNYHLLTQCSSRTHGQGSSQPIAFDFSQTNGFDSIQPDAFKDTNALASAPDTRNHLLPPKSTAHSWQSQYTPTTNLFPQHHHHQPSKSVSPPRRRTEQSDTEQATDLSRDMRLAGPASHLSSTSSDVSGWIANQNGALDELSILKQQLLNMKSANGLLHCASTSSESQHQQPALAGLSPALNTTNPNFATNLTNTDTKNFTAGHGSLPFKKRKISEPNMRY